ncbi:MAG: biotin/lipoyl-binding protein, partial [Firmicutes bacterium]|nr:biotin/lipoyl-binding protein [Bacillota bacterium]
MKKRWWIIGAIGLIAVVGTAALKGKGGKGSGDATPFRLGKVQQEALQISVREVGAVDPVTKVDVKSTVSGKIVGLKVREGAVVRAGEVLAEVEPDVNQAQTLSDVKGNLSQAKVSFRNAERDYTQQASLFKEGLISDQAYRAAKTTRDLAEEAYKAAETRYQIVEDRGI